MTTWERATDGDIQQIRLLLESLERRGDTPPVSSNDLGGITKKQAGALLTQLREMLNDSDRP